jgi:hypothetical protein
MRNARPSLALATSAGLLALVGACAAPTEDDAAGDEGSAISAADASALVGVFVKSDDPSCTFSIESARPAPEDRIEIVYAIDCGAASSPRRTYVTNSSRHVIDDRRGSCIVLGTFFPDFVMVAPCAQRNSTLDTFRRRAATPASTTGSAAAPAPTAAGGVCVRVSCAKLDVATTCRGVTGCSVAESCKGRAWSCADVNPYACYATPGCYPSSSAGKCDGFPTGCPANVSGYACTSVTGCSIDKECKGSSMAPCEGKGRDACSATPGCAFR